jgi:hypothetical protein
MRDLYAKLRKNFSALIFKKTHELPFLAFRFRSSSHLPEPTVAILTLDWSAAALY